MKKKVVIISESNDSITNKTIAELENFDNIIIRINNLGGIYQDGIKVLENIRNPIGTLREYLLKR